MIDRKRAKNHSIFGPWDAGKPNQLQPGNVFRKEVRGDTEAAGRPKSIEEPAS